MYSVLTLISNIVIQKDGNTVSRLSENCSSSNDNLRPWKGPFVSVLKLSIPLFNNYFLAPALAVFVAAGPFRLRCFGLRRWWFGRLFALRHGSRFHGGLRLLLFFRLLGCFGGQVSLRQRASSQPQLSSLARAFFAGASFRVGGVVFFSTDFLVFFGSAAFTVFWTLAIFASEPLAGTASLNDPEAPLPFVCTTAPEIMAAFKYLLMKGAIFSGSTLYVVRHVLLDCLKRRSFPVLQLSNRSGHHLGGRWMRSLSPLRFRSLRFRGLLRRAGVAPRILHRSNFRVPFLLHGCYSDSVLLSLLTFNVLQGDL